MDNTKSRALSDHSKQVAYQELPSRMAKATLPGMADSFNRATRNYAKDAKAPEPVSGLMLIGRVL